MHNISQLDISKFLPHREPFLMVDKVISINRKHVSTSFKIEKDCLFVERNRLSEMGLVECAAQTCSSIVGKSYFADDDLEGEGTSLIGFISSIKNIAIFDLPIVGSEIVVKADLISRMDTEQYSLCTLNCKIEEGKKELLSCEMILIIQEVK